MSAPVSSSHSRGQMDAILAELVESFARRLHAGEVVDVQAAAAAHPEHADELRQLLPALEALADLSRSASGAANSSAASGAVPTGGTLGDFRILREIGKGGMGIVYEAEQISLRRRVALKVLPFAATLDPRHLQRFHNEAQAAACLHHSNIVPVYSVGCDRGVHFYAMQLINGQPLSVVLLQLRQANSPGQAAAVGEAGPASPTAPRAGDVTALTADRRWSRDYFRTMAELGMQAAEALDHAHQMGIVHRDIKPANLLLDDRGSLWVTDFGLAQMQSETRLTMTGDVVGTLRYMSPEQALARRVVLDQRTDIYSLGVTLYEQLTLRPAFGGEDRQELLRQIAFEEPRRPRQINRSIPAELETIVLKAMEKSPPDRYATAHELADDLRRWLDDRPIKARRPSWRQRAAKWTRRHRTSVAAAALVLLLAVLLGGGTGLWWVQKRAVAAGEARAALKEAAELQQQGRWPEALSAARRAKGVLVGFQPDGELWQQVEQLEKDLQMIHLLEEARSQITPVHGANLPILGGVRVSFDWGASGSAYPAAFEWYGLDVDHLDAEEAGRRIRGRSIRIQLAAALDDWAFMRRNRGAQGGKHLLTIARLADPDPWRDRLRDAMEQDDPRALAELAQAAPGAELPPTTAVLLSRLTYGTPAAEQAADCLRKTWQRHPTDFSVNLELGLCLFKLFGVSPRTNREEAHRYATAAVALRPQSAGAHLQLATMFQFTSHLDEAINECQEALRLKKDCPGAHRRLGILYGAQGQYERSIAEYREAIRLKEGDWSVHGYLGEHLVALGQLDDAIRELQEAIRLYPQSPECHCKLGAALKAKARLPETAAKLRERLLEQAIAEYQAGIHLNKAHGTPDRTLGIAGAVRAHTALGDALRLTSHLDEAIAEYQKAISEDFGYMGWLFGEASDELRKAIHLDNGESTDLCILADAVAEVLKMRGQRIDVFLMYTNMIWLTSSLAEAYSRLGAALQAKGEQEKALAAFQQGIRFSKDTAHAHYKLASLAMPEGKLQVASSNYRKAVLLYEEAFAANPKPVDEPRAQHRYTAACVAVLAASAPEAEAAHVDASEQRKWRQLALSLLRDDLEAWGRLLEKESDKASVIVRKLRHWQQASDFVSIRGAEALARLTRDERAAWQKLWTDVADTLTRAEKQAAPEKKSGTKESSDRSR